MKWSTLFNLNVQDFFKGLLVAVGSAVLSLIEQTLQNGGNIDWRVIGTSALCAGIAYLIKNFFTDDQGKFLGKF